MLGHSAFLSHTYDCHGATSLPLPLDSRSIAALGGLSKERGAASRQSYSIFVPWTLSLGCGKEPNQVLVTFHSLRQGLQLVGNLKYLQTKKGCKNVTDGSYLLCLRHWVQPVGWRSCGSAAHGLRSETG